MRLEFRGYAVLFFSHDFPTARRRNSKSGFSRFRLMSQWWLVEIGQLAKIVSTHFKRTAQFPLPTTQ